IEKHAVPGQWIVIIGNLCQANNAAGRRRDVQDDGLGNGRTEVVVIGGNREGFSLGLSLRGGGAIYVRENSPRPEGGGGKLPHGLRLLPIGIHGYVALEIDRPNTCEYQSARKRLVEPARSPSLHRTAAHEAIVVLREEHRLEVRIRNKVCNRDILVDARDG